MRKYDFGGWATRNDLKCTDGRTIRRDAFKECDGAKVPIVWSHIHNDPEMVLGHAILENRPEGVYAYGYFNDTPKGELAKKLVAHGDIESLSIWANQLKQKSGDVLHGVIKEVSLVTAGANPGAFIDSLLLAHGADEYVESEDEAIITTGELLDLFHADKEDDEEEEIKAEEKPAEDTEPKEDTSKGETKMAEEKKVNSNPKTEEDDETVEDVFNTLTDKQKNVVYALIGEALKEAGVEDDEDEDEDEEGDEEDMKHNVFEGSERRNDYLSHEDMQMIFSDAKRLGSLKEAVENHLESGVLAHADDEWASTQDVEYGIAGVDYLFPEARAINATPEFVRRNDDWVKVVMDGTHHTPFSRIKSVFANLTEDEARAKGYIKGKMKKNEVFSLLKRSTDPQTIYKKQKMDRDDVLDITDFDVVAWLKAEMRLMLDEEIARAVLIGDGRLPSDDDHIKEDHIRPIATDRDLYTIKATVAAGNNSEDLAKNMIKAAIRARKDYKGSGSPIMFTSEALMTEMMLLEDGIGHPLYVDEAALARRMRVSRIVPCPVLDNFAIDGQAVYGIIVNLNDYNIGADKGGEVNMFDDFDIDYNQQKYLIETRISGALIRPYSAIVLKAATAGSGVDDNEGE